MGGRKWTLPYFGRSGIKDEREGLGWYSGGRVLDGTVYGQEVFGWCMDGNNTVWRK